VCDMEIFGLPDEQTTMEGAAARIDESHAIVSQILDNVFHAVVNRMAKQEKTYDRIQKRSLTPVVNRLKKQRKAVDQIVSNVNLAMQSRMADQRLKHAQLLSKQIQAEAGAFGTPTDNVNAVGSAPTLPPLTVPPSTVPTPGGPPTRKPPVVPPKPPTPTPSPPPPSPPPAPSPGGGSPGACCYPNPSGPGEYVMPATMNYHFTPSNRLYQSEQIWNMSPASGTLTYSPGGVPGVTNASCAYYGTFSAYEDPSDGSSPVPMIMVVMPRITPGGDAAVAGDVWAPDGVTNYGYIAESGSPCSGSDHNIVMTPLQGCYPGSPNCGGCIGFTWPAGQVPTIDTSSTSAASCTPPSPPPPQQCCPPVVVNEIKPPCGADVCPIDVPPPDTPDMQCPLVISNPDDPGTSIVIPVPGTPDWWATQDSLVSFFSTVGQDLLNWLDTWFDVGDLNGPYCSKPYQVAANDTGPVTWLGRTFCNMLQGLCQDARVYMHKFVCMWRETISYFECNGNAMMTVALLRAVVKSLEGITMGVSFPVRLTLDVPLDLPVLGRVLDYICESVCPSKIPSAGEAVRLRNYARINDAVYKSMLAANGYDVRTMEDLRILESPMPSFEQWMEFGRRNQTPDATIDTWLEQHGWVASTERALMEQLYDEIPVRSDLIQWVRNAAWNEKYVATYGLDDGFEPWWSTTGLLYVTAKGGTQFHSNMNWRASWVMPSPGQALTYLYRLSGGDDPNVPQFTIANYRDMCMAAGMPPIAQDWAVATAYQVMDASTVDTLYSTHLVDDTFLSSWLLTQGTNPADLPQVLLARQIQTARLWAAQGILLSRSTAIAGVVFGLWDANAAAAALSSQGYSGGDVAAMVNNDALSVQVNIAEQGALRARRQLFSSIVQGYRVGTIDQPTAAAALVSAGWNQASASTFLAGIDATEQSKLATVQLNAIKAAYLLGRIPDHKLPDYVNAAGVTANRAAQYVATWRAARIIQKPDVTLGDIKRMVKEGVLTLSAAETMVTNLGYVDPAHTLLLDEMEYNLSLAASKLIKAQQKSMSQAAKAAAKAKVVADKAAKAAQAAMRRDQPLSLLKSGLKCGLFSEQEVRMKMADEGYTPGEIDDFIAIWKAGKGTCVPSGAASTNGTSGS